MTSTHPVPVPATGSSTTTAPRDFLAFKLGTEEYGINILRVQEIRSYEQPAHIASAPSFIKGVLNLRGVVIPVIDMRLRLALPECHYNAFTVVIVLHVASRVVGLVVDAVSDVLALVPEQMRPAPRLEGSFIADHLLAIGSIDQRMLLLLDIDRLLSDPTMGLMDDPRVPGYT